jgi:hypothetical protein
MMERAARFLLLASAILVAGCFDQGEKEDCVGLSCPAGLFWPDGGEVRIQYIALPDGSDLRLFVSYFVKDQTPEFVEPPLLGQCFDELWYVPPDREYIDVGEDVTVKMGDEEITLPRATGDQAVDFLSRHHQVAYTAQSYTKTQDSFFDAEHSATTEKDMGFNQLLHGLYQTPKVEVLSPTGVGNRPINANEDLLVEWNELSPADPDITTGGVIIFWKKGGPGVANSETIACVGPNTGSFLVPKETIDKLPDTGIMQVGTASNQAKLTEDGRRVDLWGSTCVAFPFAKVF